MAKTNAEIAIEMQSKFELYLLGLIFTVLGLSIQTAKFGGNSTASVLELLGWAGLFLSGLNGLFRGEWVPVLYRIAAKVESTERRIAEIEQALGQGINVPVTFIENGAEQQVPGPEAVQKLRATIAVLEKQQSDGEAKVTRRYNWMKTMLVLGLVFLLASRGYEPVTTLFTAWYPGLHL